MTSSTTSVDTRFRAYVETDEELPELRPFPQVGRQILSACDDPATTARDLAHIIQCDPAVATRLLKVANSSIYGFSGEIRSVDRAVVAIGFRTIKSIAISIAAGGVFEPKSEATATESKRLWLHSLATGAISRLVAKHANIAPEDAFLAGVVHDVGKLAFLDIASSEYSSSVSGATSFERVELETEKYGITHQQIGERCADEWGLPGEVNSAISSHHEPENAYDCEEVAGIVCIANCLARYWKLGGAEGSSQELDTALERSNLGISLELFDEEFHEKVLQSFEELRTACA